MLLIYLYDGQNFYLKKNCGYMDEDGCDSIRIRLFWYVTHITLRCNVVQWCIIDIFELYVLWT